MSREIDEVALYLPLLAGEGDWDPEAERELWFICAALERDLLDAEFAALESLLPHLAEDARAPCSEAAIIDLGRALLATNWHRPGLREGLDL